MVLVLSTVQIAAAATVRGYVINPINEVRIATAEVVFFTNQGGQLQEVLRKGTDAQGNFSFSGPFIEPGLEFVLAALYQGVPYSTSPLVVGAQDQIILEVYEPTSTTDQIEVATHSIFLNVRPDRVGLGHLVQVENRGQKTFVGQGEGDQRQVLEFVLPEGIFNLTGQVQATPEGRFFDNRPLPPGLSQFFFSFEISADQLDGGYEYPVLYPTRQLDIFLDPSTIEPQGPFVDMGPVDLHDQQYRRLAMTDLEAGQRVWIPLPLSQSMRWLLKWLALGGTGLVGLLLVLVKTRPGGQASGPNPARLEEQRRQIIRRLADLDAAHGQQADSATYRTERAQLMDQATTIYRLLDELPHPPGQQTPGS
ncbi:MAG: hypothetical protein GKR89_12735 [Candidatus Latescibacteria bacterium]|nr:hypothetical protein [Candidatus Latescibacterota bacterium]